MCGLAGFLGYGCVRPDDVQAVATRMGDAIRHRGPDDSGVWMDDAAQLALVHRRLAIVDLSPTGHQPMVSAGGRYVIAFNGEIYNHDELRRELEREAIARHADAFRWRGRSDTETLLAAIEAWGLDDALRRSTGMFAIALWDRHERALYLARDRMGEKPLYYGWQRGVFLFGSELKALRAHPAFEGTIDRDAVALQVQHNCVPAPRSIYKDIAKLPAGCVLRLSSDGDAAAIAPRAYWSLPSAVEHARASPFSGSDDEAVAALDRVLRDAVARQMVADVPLGAFLSGGVDSSTVVALMQAQSPRPVRTFTIGFGEQSHDEARHARAVAGSLGTDHRELRVTPRDALDVIPRLPTLYDEPFSDASQIPTFLLAQMTRRHVTVSLSGDAGDELFGGYDEYVTAARWLERAARLPLGPRRAVAGLATSLPASVWARLERVVPRGGGALPLRDKVYKGAGILAGETFDDMFRRWVRRWDVPDFLATGPAPRRVVPPDAALSRAKLTGVERMMVQDAAAYLLDDILCKVDRAAMAVSLETRMPLLDHHVVEFAWRLPRAMKIRNGQGKWILRQVLHRYVAKELVDRPKMGFCVPLDSWLRGPLRSWAEDLLDEGRLRREGFFEAAPVRRMWQEHLTGTRDRQHDLWGILMFQAWLALQHRA